MLLLNSTKQSIALQQNLFYLKKTHLNHYPTKCLETWVTMESKRAYTAFIIIIMVAS